VSDKHLRSSNFGFDYFAVSIDHRILFDSGHVQQGNRDSSNLQYHKLYCDFLLPFGYFNRFSFCN
jgi:hypothetical protein